MDDKFSSRRVVWPTVVPLKHTRAKTFPLEEGVGWGEGGTNR